MYNLSWDSFLIAKRNDFSLILDKSSYSYDRVVESWERGIFRKLETPIKMVPRDGVNQRGTHSDHAHSTRLRALLGFSDSRLLRKEREIVQYAQSQGRLGDGASSLTLRESENPESA